MRIAKHRDDTCRNPQAVYRKSVNHLNSRPRLVLAAFTLIELLVVVAVVMILASLVFPLHHKGSGEKARTIQCLSNLKLVSLGFNMWSDDHGKQFPWNVSTNASGSRELIPNGNAADHFVLLSNLVPQASVLFCPSDRAARLRTDSYLGFSNTNLSYFVSLATRSGNIKTADQILAGDRRIAVNSQLVPSGLFVATNLGIVGWKSAHVSRGVLGFMDGHAEAIRTDVLPGVFQRQAIPTNQLVIP